MNAWTGWEAVRRQVVACGRVLDAAGEPVAQARVALDPARAQPATTRPDGFFWFVDLPAGRYQAVARDAAGARQGSAKFSVSYQDGTAARAAVDIRLAPRAAASPP